MRRTMLVTVAASLTVLGATCLPLVDLDDDQIPPPPPTLLAGSIVRPASDRTVPQSGVVTVEWTAGNLTGGTAIATLLVRNREDRSETILSGGIVVTSTGARETFDWDTSDFEPAAYNVILRLSAGSLSDEVIGPGVITIATTPTLVFTEPFENVTLEDPDPADDDNTPPTVLIRWSGFDPDEDGKLELGVDPDADHDNGNENVILERDLPREDAFDSFEWDGNDIDGTRVAAGTYEYFARLTDEFNEARTVRGLAQITVPQAPDPQPEENAVTEPAEDRQFLTSETSTQIAYTIAEDADVLIDLKLDTDDAHQNGNEVTILSQRLVEAATSEGTFDWTGTNSAGVAVADGIYRVFMLLNRGSGNPATLDAEGLIFRRSAVNKPLVGALQPSMDQTLNAGQFLTIQWRDDDPGDVGTIVVSIDDDANPQEAVETGMGEMDVLSGRDATGDDVQDTLLLQVPATLVPGTYFIFVYIDEDGVRPFTHSSVAPGRLIIDDPTMN